MTMKLTFLDASQPPVLLHRGIHRIGPADWADIRLPAGDGIPVQAELYIGAHQASIGAVSGAEVLVNGEAIAGMTRLADGDTLRIAHMQFRFDMPQATAAAPTVEQAAVEVPAALRVPAAEYFRERVPAAQATPSPPSPSRPRPDAVTSTRIQQALPRYVLRGISSGNMGWTFPLPGPSVVGRSSDCDIRIENTGLSRVHARLTPTVQGLLVEDLQSTNGTLLNEKRIGHTAVAHHGDEIGFDVLRFRLVATDANQTDAVAHAGRGSWQQSAQGEPSDHVYWVLAACVLLIPVLLVLWFW